MFRVPAGAGRGALMPRRRDRRRGAGGRAVGPLGRRGAPRRHRRARGRAARLQPRAARRGAGRRRRRRRDGGRGRGPGPARRRAGRPEGQPLHHRRPHDLLVEDPRGLEAALRRHRGRSGSPPPGAIAIGKTNLDEFAMGSSTENSAFGPVARTLTTPPRCPAGPRAAARWRWRPASRRSALGSDTGGSIRQPAALCGVVGMKPTYGRVSRYGLVAFASSLDQIGPFAATVADAAALYDVIAGHDDRDSTSIPEPSPPTPGVARPGRRRACGSAWSPSCCQAEGIAADVTARVAGRRRGARPRPAPRSTRCRCPPRSTGCPPTT